MKEFVEDGIKERLIQKREEFELVLKNVQTNLREELKMGVVTKSHIAECGYYNMPSINGARLPILKKCLKKLNEALVRIDEGTYGICTTCGEQIPIKRLIVVPFAAQCVPCKEKTNNMLV
ncbi:MAG: TraR/DksA C4-type zinc finger protein [Candidatus Portnoybacteria bacterium]|nr:TraR/DksA C4-type zinc finger protein [Candidatus Portnoybacteria bacterium]